jgi:DNA repair protein RecO (recombination protein O)
LDVCYEHVNDLTEPLLISYFEINFLAEMGFSPELHECVSCQNKIESGQNNFDFVRGGLVCSSCGSGRPISDQAIKLIRLSLEHSFNSIKKVVVTPELIEEIKSITSFYLKHIHQKEFVSEKYLS